MDYSKHIYYSNIIGYPYEEIQKKYQITNDYFEFLTADNAD